MSVCSQKEVGGSAAVPAEEERGREGLRDMAAAAGVMWHIGVTV